MKIQYNIFFKKNVKYVFHKNYLAYTLFNGILYIPGGRDHERTNMTDDLQLLNNYKRSFTEVIKCLRSLFVKHSSLTWVPCVCLFPYINQLCYQICAADGLSKE